VQALITILREVRDPRDCNARHDCASMLFTALLATLCGCKSCVEIADFCAAYVDDLAEVVDFPHGAPSHDSFSRLFRLLDPNEMASAFSGFARALREGLGLGPVKGVVSIDGKRLRRGYERGKAHFPPLMISVWDAETRISLAARVGEGGNEVAGTLEALKGLDLKGCTVTADALHCHPAMAAAVRARKGHYALKLKTNNRPLYEQAGKAFEQADAKGGVPFAQTEERGHDRHELRRMSLAPAPKEGANLPGLVMFGRMQTQRNTQTRTGNEHTYYVAFSQRRSARNALQMVRAHWGVENQLHWPLDVVFREDDARTRKDNAPQNLAIIRRMAKDILESHPENVSVARKMKRASWSKDYLFNLFAHMR
jgi:predicted transposase YbfD/YdcC